MPFVSKKQKSFFGMCKSPKGRKKAKTKCPPVSVIDEFFAAERAKKPGAR